MGRCLKRLKTLLQSIERPSSSVSSTSTEEPKTVAVFSTADPSDKTAETSPTKGFVSFGSSSATGESDFSRRTCGTCRHALRDLESHPTFGWRFCGLGWVGGFADYWHCDDWQDTASASPHDAQVDRAKAWVALGYSLSNAIAKAYGERVQGDRP